MKINTFTEERLLARRPIPGAIDSLFQRHRYEVMLREEHQKWDIHSPELGVSLHAMQQLGHWPVGGPVAELRRQGGHPVAVGIARLAEEIINNTDQHDVREWANDILTLTGGNSAPRNR